ncbi:flippase-like domain-containing protein [Candidatus Saccharibacteria bacterium]|nr:flippase-like domain-containing protein [Candidatus Saccharibacteria bacterium]
MFKKILSVVTLVLVAFIAYNAFSAEVVVDGQTMTMLEATWNALKSINIWVLLLIIPEQILMYYAAGQIYFAFLTQRKNFKITHAKLTRISLEINFVNHALPSGGTSGLAYLIWRLKEFNISAGQISFVHILRYGICAIGNAAQTLFAIIFVLIAGCVVPGGMWAVWLSALIAFGILGLITVAWLIVRKQKNIDWLADKSSKFINRIVRRLSRGKKRKFLKEENVSKFFNDLREDYLSLKKNRRILGKPMAWGLFYSFLELATYWVVGCALGHPEILPQIMIAEGVGSVVGTVMVTPGGMGGYEGAFVAVLVATGVDLQVATITVIVTRVLVLLGTIISGYGFYQHAIMQRPDKFKTDAVPEEQ